MVIAATVQRWLMGRNKEHVASKSFTIGMKELAFLCEESDRLEIKQSKLLTKYIRTIMLEHLEKEKIQHGPITWCTKCGDHREFKNPEHSIGVRWICSACGEDKTSIIKEMFPSHQI